MRNPITLNFVLLSINKSTMTKKAEKQKVPKPVDKSVKIEKEKKKPGRKPLKAPITSPRPEIRKPKALSMPNSPKSQTVEEAVSPVKKQRGRKPANKISMLTDPVDERIQKEGSELVESVRHVSEEAEPHNDEVMWRQMDNLSQTIHQLKQVTINKIEELRVHVDNSIRTPAPIELSASFAELIRKMISDQISKEFETQFERFKENFVDTELNRIHKIKKRGRPSKIELPSPRSSNEDINEPPTQKKRGRKKKTMEDLSPEKNYVAKNVSSVAEMVDDPRRDFRINNIITFSNLTEQPVESRKENTKNSVHTPQLPESESQSELEPEPEPEPEPEVEIVDKKEQEPEPEIASESESIQQTTPQLESEPVAKEVGSSALLPSVPLKSIQILIEDHKSELADTKKSISSETPVSKKVKRAKEVKEMKEVKEQKDDVRSVRTEVDVGKNVESEQDMELEFDFNAFSLNS